MTNKVIVRHLTDEKAAEAAQLLQEKGFDAKVEPEGVTAAADTPTPEPLWHKQASDALKTTEPKKKAT